MSVASNPVEQLSASSLTVPTVNEVSVTTAQLASRYKVISTGVVKVGLIVSRTLIVCTWFVAVLPHASTKLHVLSMV